MFAYQTGEGRYARPGGPDSWRLKGWLVTDARGRFTFRTLRPAPYPRRQVPAHIHVPVATKCRGHQFADLMFDQDPFATPVYRKHYAAVGEHGLYGVVRRDARGTQVVSCTMRLREHDNF